MITKGSTLKTVHEGQKILELLKARGLDIQSLADAGERITWSAAKKYIKAEKLGAKAWEKVSAKLTKLGIDPTLIRPTPKSATKTADLRPYLTDFDRGHLEALKSILEADEVSRERLLLILEDRLTYGRCDDETNIPVKRHRGDQNAGHTR